MTRDEHDAIMDELSAPGKGMDALTFAEIIGLVKTLRDICETEDKKHRHDLLADWDVKFIAALAKAAKEMASDEAGIK